MTVYSKWKGIHALSIKDRIKAFREEALLMIQTGTSIEDIRVAASDCTEDEFYEVAEGILKAIQDFQDNPQTKLI